MESRKTIETMFQKYKSDSGLNLTTNIKEINDIPSGEYDFFMNLKIMNQLGRINKFHERINSLINVNGYYISCCETMEMRNKRLFDNKFHFIKFFYIFSDFILHRVIPRISYLNKVYFLLGGKKYRVLSRAEALGRLVSCGFEIIQLFEDKGLSYIVAKKKSTPFFKKSSYGPLFKMTRVGKNKKRIHVYKFRTMHPFSEYLQQYIRDNHGYGKNSHKLKDDFRITSWGKFFRKYWLDELPQLINVFKGEMKIIGIRPLSEVFFNELPEDLKVERLKHKPACIPVYVSLCMKGIDGFVRSERKYLKDRKNNKYLTDFKYTFLAIKNIITGKIKSS